MTVLVQHWNLFLCIMLLIGYITAQHDYFVLGTCSTCENQRGNNKLKIYVDGQQVEQVSQFRWLNMRGWILHKRYPAQNWDGKKVFMEKKILFTDKMNLELKKRIMKCLVWSVAAYAAETWMLTQTGRRRLEVFEMWIWKR